MLVRWYLITLFVSINYANENGFNIFDTISSYKNIIQQMTLIKPQYNAKISTKWIEQPLNHFDIDEKSIWRMKYFENLEFWRSGGPIYLFLGGEAPASEYLITTGIMYELASETNGSMYASEHRYYGQSKPFNGTTAEDLKFLSARQALADNAKLLENIKSSPDFNSSKVVVVGGSYSGNLAAWMKELYPNLVDAAIASSGPVLAKKNFFEYIEKVNENYVNYGDSNCIDKIKYIFNRYETLLMNETGIAKLKQEENICANCNMTRQENKQIFFISKISPFMYLSQYGTTEDITAHCNSLNSSSGVKNFWNARQKCHDYSFDLMIEEYHKAENDWILTWTYQTCNEFGYFQTTSSDLHPFTKNVPVDLYVKTCTALFGDDFNEERVDKGVKEVNKLYGGLKPNVTNVVFTNGDIDPWSTLGVLEDISYDAPAVVISRASHCRDLFSDRDGDAEELKEARKHIKYLIKKWINAFPYRYLNMTEKKDIL